jgi:MFS family permease
MMGQGGAFGALFPVQAKNEVGLSSAQIGEMLTIAGIVGLIITYPNGWAVDRFGRKPTLIPGLGFLALAAIVLANLTSIDQIYIMLVFYGLGSAMSMGASQAFAVDLAPPDRRGSFLGLWTLIGNIGAIVAPLLIGAVATNLGYTPGYIIVATLLLLSAGFMLFFGPETKAQRERQAAAAGAAVTSNK